MSATIAQPPAPEVPLSETQRLLNVFVAPSKTFTDLRRNASWWVPWLLTSVLSVLYVFVVDRQIGFEQVTKTEIARSPRADQFDKLPADQQARQIQLSTTITRYISYCSPIFGLVGLLLVAVVLMVTFNVGAGGGVPFKTSMAISAYGGLPNIIGVLLGIISLFAGVDPQGFNIRYPAATNPAYFMSPTDHRFLYGMASALDIFVIWSIVLMGIGFACNSKVKRPSAIAIVAGWYLVYKLVGTGLGMLF
ncbi:MAG TPA: YIP1 family protein [Terriglobales bacterium]